MYERFTTRARKVIEFAEQEAHRSNSSYLGTVHILLGLIQVGGDVIGHALKNLGIEPGEVQGEVEKIVEEGGDKLATDKLVQSPGVKSVICYAIEEAEIVHDKYVETEHLLLGLMRVHESVAFQVLQNHGVNLPDLRNEILLLLDHDVRSKEGRDTQSRQAADAPPIIAPMPRRWTRDEVYRMAALGLFHGEQTELIEGEIMVSGRQTAEHYSTLDCVAGMLRLVFGAGFWVGTRRPLTFSRMTEPEPDVSVVLGRPADYSDHPTMAVLIVEVSDSSLDYDRTHKASLYARAGIADYWIVNLVNNQVEVHRDPRPDATQHYGYGYASVTILVPPAVVNPLAAPQVALAVVDLLP